MNSPIKTNVLIYLFIFATVSCIGQIEDFEYKAPIRNVSQGWNSINLPLEVFNKTKRHLNDIRIYQQNTVDKKSIEQPYILDIETSEGKYEIHLPKIINTTSNNGVYYYTFELTNKKAINRIFLDFKNKNFDWNIHLEGSMDQNSWSTIIKNYRITSFKRSDVSFKLTNLTIPESKFNFYKISFKSDQKPELESVSIRNYTRSTPNYNLYDIKKITTNENAELKTSVIVLDLGKNLPVGELDMVTNYKNDYYRPFKIEGIVDSFNTDKGWKYNYEVLFKGSVNSVNENNFNFGNSIVNKLKITVYNFDNQPLSFTDFTLKGPNYRVITRLEDIHNHFFVFGNNDSKKPKYDITYFEDKIPETLNLATLGKIEYHPKASKKSSPLFKNKWWLWASMIIVILLLGTFTLKMVREKE